MRLLVALFGIALAGCQKAGDERPALPPLELSERQDWLERQQAGAPAPPSEERLAELRDLMLTGFSDEFGSRLSGRARERLLRQDDAFRVLEEGLSNEDASIREHCLFELGRLQRPASILPLLLRLKYEPDQGLKAHVAGALFRLGNGAGLVELIRQMAFEPTAEQAGLVAIEICQLAKLELGEQPTYVELTRALERLADDWKNTGRTAIGRGDPDPSLDPLVQGRVAEHLLALRGTELRPVDDARFVLSRAGRLALPLLKQTVRASEPYLRAHSLEIVRDLGRAAAELGPEILPLLADPLSRADAARTLGELGETRAAPFLIDMLADPDVELRAAAASALGPLRVEAAILPLQARLDDPDEVLDVRVMAAFSLAIFELDRPARDFLLERRRQGDFHGPTIDELLDRLDEIDRRRSSG